MAEPTPTPEPLAVDAARAAAICGVSRALWWKLDGSGRCPMPIRLGRRCLWRVDELRAWVGAGCPPRSAWQARQYLANKAVTLKTLKEKTAG